MKLILAMSGDEYLCKNDADDMNWTGGIDKAIFRLLTLSDGEVLAAGMKTYKLMPKLKDRHVIPLRQEGRNEMDGVYGSSTLAITAKYFPNAWLIGGPKTAKEALERGFIHRAFICQVLSKTLGEGVLFEPLEELLPKDYSTVRFKDNVVRIYEVNKQ
jgi:dihydrofolate reductase